jgi:hypothetical protein
MARSEVPVKASCFCRVKVAACAAGRSLDPPTTRVER